MGLYTGDLDRIGVLSFDAWRASRLVVDTGHARARLVARAGRSSSCSSTRRWPRTTSSTRSTATSCCPGQALAYKTGQLELLRLRDEARAALGAGFDIRAFHDAVLGNGAIALPTLRGVVETWVTGISGSGGASPA